MRPDDPRHGTPAGYKAHSRAGEKACTDCTEAAARYVRHQAHDMLHGRPRLVSSRGFTRRVQALQAIGWSLAEISDELGISRDHIWHKASTGSKISASSHRQMAEVYDRLSMRVPSGSSVLRVRNHAVANGWAPPLAWDDIDLDDAPTFGDPTTDLIDEVAIQRVLSGDGSATLTTAERFAVTEQWLLRGRTLAELARVTGWKVDRYVNRNAA